MISRDERLAIRSDGEPHCTARSCPIEGLNGLARSSPERMPGEVASVGTTRRWFKVVKDVLSPFESTVVKCVSGEPERQAPW